MNQEPVSQIESKLTRAFERVTPSRAFVNTVRERIQSPRPRVLIERFSPKKRGVLLALGGVLSASLLILTLARVLYYLLGRSKQAV
jgi:hypothetical protein